jgi:sulfate transport system ATP-binding protein
MVVRVVHLGFEVRVELELPGGDRAHVQLTRYEAQALELRAGDFIYVKLPSGRGEPEPAAA